MSARVRAVSKALYQHNAIDDFGGPRDDYPADEFDCCAREALDAADAVMFSDAFIDAAAQEIHGEFGEFWAAMSEEQRENRRNVVRSVIAALKGFGDE